MYFYRPVDRIPIFDSHRSGALSCSDVSSNKYYLLVISCILHSSDNRPGRASPVTKIHQASLMESSIQASAETPLFDIVFQCSLCNGAMAGAVQRALKS